MIAETLLGLGILGTLGTLATPVITSQTKLPEDQLPAEWVAGDFGTPAAWNDTTVWIYADIADGDRRFARNAISIDGEFLIQPLVAPDPDGFHWITDMTQLPDGTMLVVALEGRNRHDLANDGWAFEITDTDMFVVRDPSDVDSWRIAMTFGKLDDGWWDLKQVEFSDQWPGMAFTRDVYGDGVSHVYSYDPADITQGDRGERLPVSDGPFAPVQTATGWMGYSWDWESNTATLWSAPSLDAEWTAEPDPPYGQQTHAHGLNVVDGEVVHRWSVFRSRPAYQALTLETS